MKCTNCGNEIAPGAQYCQVCGAPAAQQPQQQPQYQQPAQQPYQQKPVNLMDAPDWGKVLAVLFPLIGFGIWASTTPSLPGVGKGYLRWSVFGLVLDLYLLLLFI